jgi:tetratricopeptide (TPR) repeat protein
VRFYQQGWTTNPGAILVKAEELANSALGIRDDFDGRWNLAMVYWNQGKFDESFGEYEAAAQRWEDHVFDPGFEEYVALRAKDSKNPDLTADVGEARIYAGEPDVAIELVEEAIDIRGKMDGPLAEIPHWYRWNGGRARYMDERYQDAIDEIGRITDPLPNDVLLIIAASKAQLGEVDAAMTYMAQFRQNDPEWSIAKAAERYFRRDSDRLHWLDGLLKAGLK